MATITGLTAARMLEIEANSVKAISKTVTRTVLAIPVNGSATGTLLLGKAYRLDQFVVNKACRLRLYASAAQRTIDADRGRSIDPVGNHGVITEIFATVDLLSMLLLPMPHGYVTSGTTYFSVVNDDSTGDLTFTFTEHVLED